MTSLRSLKTWSSEARRMMASKRHDPPLFRDADGDEAHEFWEETVPGRGDMARNTNVHEAWRPIRAHVPKVCKPFEACFGWGVG